MNTFVKVGKYANLPDAQIAIGRLEAEGIRAFMANAHLAQVLPGLMGPIPVLVAAENEAAARRILETDYSDHLEDDDETT